MQLTTLIAGALLEFVSWTKRSKRPAMSENGNRVCPSRNIGTFGREQAGVRDNNGEPREGDFDVFSLCGMAT